MTPMKTLPSLTAGVALALALAQGSTAQAAPVLPDSHLALSHYINGVYLRQGHCRFTREQQVLTIRASHLHPSETCTFAVYFNDGELVSLPVRPLPFRPVRFYLNQGRA